MLSAMLCAAEKSSAGIPAGCPEGVSPSDSAGGTSPLPSCLQILPSGTNQAVRDLVLQQLPRNHQPLNLASPFANGAQLHVAIKLLRRIVLDEPISAVDLHPF